jgi:hypothetical protein
VTIVKKATLSMCALATIALVLPAAAHAGEGAVKVACGDNNCDNVTLGAVCDTFSIGSEPVALSCENTATPGGGTPKPCGAAQGTCTSSALSRPNPLGFYCFGSPIGGDNDAVVICDTTPEPIRTADDAAGVDPDEDK